MATYTGMFAPLAEGSKTNPKKRQRLSTHSSQASGHQVLQCSIPSKQDFVSMESDAKLNTLFDMMVKIGNTNNRLDEMTRSTYYCTARCDITEARLRVLEYKSIDADARLLRNNLLFNGLPEVPNVENCHDIIKSFLRDKLNLEPTTIHISKAQRIGRPRPVQARGVSRPRTILVTFRDANDVETIMSNTRLLARTNYGISRDYPREIADARRELWGDYKQARSRFGPRNVKLRFPAALEVNGDVVRDLFPRWYETLRGSRNSNVTARTQQRFSGIVAESLRHQARANTVQVVDESEPDESSESSTDESDSDTQTGRTPPPAPTETPAAPENVELVNTPVDPARTAAGFLLRVHAPMGGTITNTEGSNSVPNEPDVETPLQNSVTNVPEASI